MQALLIIYVAGGLILTLVSLPLIFGKIKPNIFYGFRIPATLEDPELWYPVNRSAGKGLFFAGLVMIASAIGLFFWPGISVDTYAYAFLGIFVVTFTIVIVKSVQVLRSLQANKKS